MCTDPKACFFFLSCLPEAWPVREQNRRVKWLGSGRGSRALERERKVPSGSWEGRDSIPLVDESRNGAGSRGDEVQRVIRWRVAGGKQIRSCAARE